jgi:hypothetical protein
LENRAAGQIEARAEPIRHLQHLSHSSLWQL